MDTPKGSLTPDQLELIVRVLPCDLSFADEHDVLRFWKGQTYGSCKEHFIGRDVRDCHPGHSLAVLEEILHAFRSGARDVAEGWRQADRHFKYTRYCAVRDDEGAYRGILEINQDLTDLRALEGVRQLPGW
jgi:DUF438 domain-containing protein